MSASNSAPQLPSTPPKKSRVLSLRRIALLATTVAGLGAAAFVAAPDFKLSLTYPAAIAQNLTEQAKRLPAPNGFADIVEQVKPAVISVRVQVDNGPATTGRGNTEMENVPPGMREFFRRFGMPEGMPGQRPGMGPRGGRGPQTTTGQGSGFFISADGYAVTNNHVVDKAESVEVRLDDGKTYKAKVIGTDPRTDLALIKVDGASFPFVKLADKSPRIGDWVLAVGNPFGLSSTVTAGIVSARGRDIGASAYDDFIQIDAPVNKGNSGGPAFDVEGNVIGVNTAIYSPSGGSVGIAFAIPADTVKSVVAQLKDHGAVTRGWIGVQIQPVTKDIADSLGLKKTVGALVAEPQSGGPAAKAGIKAGDVITAVNGEEVKDARDLAKKIGAMQPKQDVKLTVLSGGSEKTISLSLGTLPGDQQAKANSDNDSDTGSDVGKLGLTLAPASRVAGAGSEGVVVTDVDGSGAAAERGFAIGDVILEVAGKKVESPNDVRKAIDAVRTEGKRTVLLRVKKGDNSRFVALPVTAG